MSIKNIIYDKISNSLKLMSRKEGDSIIVPLTSGAGGTWTPVFSQGVVPSIYGGYYLQAGNSVYAFCSAYLPYGGGYDVTFTLPVTPATFTAGNQLVGQQGGFQMNSSALHPYVMAKVGGVVGLLPENVSQFMGTGAWLQLHIMYRLK